MEEKTLINRPLKWWLNESDFYGTICQFKHAREPFNNFINKGDRVLDLGCANGFLLYMLQQWQKNDFIPYGIDIKKQRIKMAKQLLLPFSKHFSVENMYAFHWGGKLF